MSGHGAVVLPPPRNNIDHGELPWSGPVPSPVPAVDDHSQGFWCPVADFNSSLSGSVLVSSVETVL